MTGGRILSDEDVEAIVKELKKSILTDLHLEAGKGLFFWLRKAFWLLVIALVLYGMFGDKIASKPASAKLGLDGSKPVATQVLDRVAVAPPAPTGFTVIPPHDTPADIYAMAEEIDRLNGRAA